MCYWYKNKVRIYGDAEKMQKEIRKLLMNGKSEGHADSWLGSIVAAASLGTVEEGLPSDIDCRGSILSMEADGNRLDIVTQTAEKPNVSLFRSLFRDAEIDYLSCGDDGYVESNSLENIGRYLFRAWGNAPDIPLKTGEWELADEQDMKRTVQELLGSSEDDASELVRMFNYKYGDCCTLHRVEAGSADMLDGCVEFEIS